MTGATSPVAVAPPWVEGEPAHCSVRDVLTLHGGPVTTCPACSVEPADGSLDRMVRDRDHLDGQIAAAVARMRAAGVIWADIGVALHMSGQAARRRYGAGKNGILTRAEPIITTCRRCGGELEQPQRNARYCSDACRKAQKQSREAARRARSPRAARRPAAPPKADRWGPTRPCQHCGVEFTPSASFLRYCSTECRLAGYAHGRAARQRTRFEAMRSDKARV